MNIPQLDETILTASDQFVGRAVREINVIDFRGVGTYEFDVGSRFLQTCIINSTGGVNVIYSATKMTMHACGCLSQHVNMYENVCTCVCLFVCAFWDRM